MTTGIPPHTINVIFAISVAMRKLSAMNTLDYLLATIPLVKLIGVPYPSAGFKSRLCICETKPRTMFLRRKANIVLSATTSTLFIATTKETTKEVARPKAAL